MDAIPFSGSRIRRRGPWVAVIAALSTPTVKKISLILSNPIRSCLSVSSDAGHAELQGMHRIAGRAWIHRSEIANLL